MANYYFKTLIYALLLSIFFLSQFSCKQDKEDQKSVVNNPKNGEVSLYEEGQFLFQQNCGMCHKTDKQAAGIALNSFPNTLKENELFDILVAGKKHPNIKITKEETVALTEFINNKKP